jgi:CheY-like chemotaxis protein
LWIAKGITSIHGGAIGVECEEVGKGSMFYVELPLIEGIQSSPQSSQSQPHSPGNRVSSVNDNTNGESKSDGVVGHRVWSWRDPRNNIDQKNIITPTSKKNVSYFQSDPSTQQSQKVIPLNLTTRNTQGPADPNSDILTQKNIHPQISSDMSQANSARKYFSHDAFPDPRPLRILVVDDVKSIRKLFARALSNQGHSCDTACDGQECVDLFTKKSEDFPSSTPLGSLVPVPVAVDACPYDLVLMDSEMPVMNGPTATKIIRSLGFKELVVFGVTGNVLPEDVEMFMNHGVDAVLGKPLTLEKMWEEYDRIIKEKSQRSNLDLVSGERL